MFNVKYLNDFLKHSFKDIEEGHGEIKEIGTLNLYDRAIKFVYDNMAIYANGQVILSTSNDAWTAASTFALTMKAVFGEGFSVDKGFM